MKVLFVNNFRGRGGGEEFLRDLLPGLLARGIRIGLICRPGRPLEDMFRGSAVDLYPIERSGSAALSSPFRIARILRREHYDIVNIQRGHDIIQTLLGVWLSGTRPVLIYTPQVPEFIRSRFLLRRMDAIVTISRHIRDRLTGYDRGLASRIRIIYYGIDLERFKTRLAGAGFLRDRFGLGPDTKIIGTVGDLWKNQIEFLDVLARVRARLPDARFAIVGNDADSGPVRAFRQKAEDLGLAHAVLWPGRLAKDDMRSFYADIDMAESTYRNEGFGIWVLEAMAMGRPMVAYREGGIRDSVEGSPCGLLADDADDMARKIVSVLEDPAVHAAMSKAAPEWVARRFARQRMIDDYAAYFHELAGPGRSDG